MTDPPELVQIRSELRVRNLRDDDRAMQSLAYAIDALHLPQGQEQERFKKGLFLARAFFVDDNPRQCLIHKPEQCIERVATGLRLIIEPWEGPREGEGPEM